MSVCLLVYMSVRPHVKTQIPPILAPKVSVIWQQTLFLFGSSQIQILVRRLAIKIEGFRRVPQSLREIVDVVKEACHDRFLPLPFYFILRL